MGRCQHRLNRCAVLFLAFLLGFGVPVPDAALAQRRVRKPAATDEGPPSPKLFKSANFHVMTDLPRDDAEELLKRLETMLKLVSAYWGRRNPRTIEMFVVDDIKHWPEGSLAKMSPEGLLSIRTGGGLTVTEVISSGQRFISKAIVYAGADHGTPQHEAVHAYCGHAFGELGPVWYAEGMAEVGNYWRENDKSVNADPVVIKYLRSGAPRPLNDIVDNPLETSGDSGQNYAWRWALCHLLGFNENYTQRFKPLGMAFLAGQDVSFWKVYGTQAKEIEFEYQLFLKDMQPGYRCDLCSWDWKTKFKGLLGSASVQARIRADRGWQGSRLKVLAGTEYEYSTDGTWKLSPDGDPVTPDGDADGAGRLIGVLFNDYQLSDPIELGATGTFTAPANGDLFLRCRDGWADIGDNGGAINVKLRLKGNAVARGREAPPGTDP